MKAIILSLLFIISCSQKAIPASSKASSSKTLILAGGCFWCVESDLEKIYGVSEVTSGYSGGSKENANYKAVSSHKSKHLEVVKVIYDPKIINYSEIIEIFWTKIDPTDPKGQFVDKGHQYISAIYFDGDEERNIAEKSKHKLNSSGKFQKPIVTKILKRKTFYPAEDYHQDYYKKSPIRYKYYRYRSGRDHFLNLHWKTSDSKAELKKKLTALQYKVTQEDGTEPAFKNLYWDNKKEGIYVDIVSGEALFSSKDKFKSGTGWPSFSKVLVESNIIEKTDTAWGMKRTEVRSKKANSHLGHLFNDGPKPTGLRYCINSASLKFIPKDSLKNTQYKPFTKLFKNP